MTTEERVEKLERELTAAKQINRWKLAFVTLAVSLLCMVAKDISFVTTANAKLARVTKSDETLQREMFVTGNADQACLWREEYTVTHKGQRTSNSKLVFVNRARAQ